MHEGSEMGGTAFIIIVITIIDAAVVGTAPNYTSLKSLENAVSYFREPEISYLVIFQLININPVSRLALCQLQKKSTGIMNFHGLQEIW